MASHIKIHKSIYIIFLIVFGGTSLVFGIIEYVGIHHLLAKGIRSKGEIIDRYTNIDENGAELIHYKVEISDSGYKSVFENHFCVPESIRDYDIGDIVPVIYLKSGEYGSERIDSFLELHWTYTGCLFLGCLFLILAYIVYRKTINQSMI